MGTDASLLLMENPELFMQAVLNDDAQARMASLHTFDDLMTCEFLRYGIFNDPAQARHLMRMYDELFLPAPIESREAVCSHVAAIAQQLGGHTAGALTPFMLLDENHVIVSKATIEYVSIGSLNENDPMSRPKNVVTMIMRGIPRNPAAVMGGLVAIGDPRVCALLAPLRGSLDVRQTEIVTQTFSGLTTKSQVEFYLDWLEELVDRDDYEGLSLFGHVTAGLYRLADRRLLPWIADGLRPFPVPNPGEEKEEEEWSSITKIEPREFANSIADRLYDLEQRESAPKVIPHVIRAFGLIPRTPLSDTSNIQ
jgi:hypothetical protein